MPNAPVATLPTLHTINEAAEIVGIPLSTMRKIAYARQVETVKFVKRVYIPDHALRAWINKATRPAVGNAEMIGG